MTSPSSSWRRSLLTRLSSLAADDLALVLDALALVRLRRADLPDVGGDLADQLLVDAGDRELRRPLDREADAGRRDHVDRVREAQSELEVLALGGHPVTGAVDLQRLLVALGDADDHVGDQSARQAVELLGLPLVVGAVDVQLVALLSDRDRLSDGVRELALGTLDLDGLAR